MDLLPGSVRRGAPASAIPCKPSRGPVLDPDHQGTQEAVSAQPRFCPGFRPQIEMPSQRRPAARASTDGRPKASRVPAAILGDQSPDSASLPWPARLSRCGWFEGGLPWPASSPTVRLSDCRQPSMAEGSPLLAPPSILRWGRKSVARSAQPVFRFRRASRALRHTSVVAGSSRSRSPFHCSGVQSSR